MRAPLTVAVLAIASALPATALAQESEVVRLESECDDGVGGPQAWIRDLRAPSRKLFVLPRAHFQPELLRAVETL